jgi:protein MAK16
VIEKEGICYLHIKTVERAHLPRDLWEKVKLQANFGEALRQIEENLEYWPSHLINRCKQRLTRIRQTLTRMRKLALRDRQLTLVPIKTKTVKREATREAKAERAAQVEKTVQMELLERLRQGKFGIYNYPFNQFNTAVEELPEEEVEQEYEYEESEMSEADIEDFLAGEDEEFDGGDFGDDDFDDGIDYGALDGGEDEEGIILDDEDELRSRKKQKTDFKKKGSKKKVNYVTESVYEDDVEGIIE